MGSSKDAKVTWFSGVPWPSVVVERTPPAKPGSASCPSRITPSEPKLTVATPPVSCVTLSLSGSSWLVSIVPVSDRSPGFTPMTSCPESASTVTAAPFAEAVPASVCVTSCVDSMPSEPVALSLAEGCCAPSERAVAPKTPCDWTGPEVSAPAWLALSVCAVWTAAPPSGGVP